MARAFYHHKVLLDENMPKRSALPLLNKHFQVKHISADLHQEGLDDPAVYDLAVSLGCVLITRNLKHFRPLAGTKHDAGVITVSQNLVPEQLDTKLTAFLKRARPADLAGTCQFLPASRRVAEQDQAD
jgi:Domain of unknown function (DUF5615)